MNGEELKASMEGMRKEFERKFFIPGYEKIHFAATGRYQEYKHNENYEGFWSGWMAKRDQLPKYCTPEQYKKLTGQDWPSNAPVWFLNFHETWILDEYNINKPHESAVIANADGKPPADYRPESGK